MTEQKKHNKQSKEKINPVSVVVMVLIGAFVIFGIASLFGSGDSSTNFDTDKLGQCIVDNGAIFYGTEWCGICKNQKVMLGDTFKDHGAKFYVDCDLEGNRCTAAGIRGYPTWIINGVKYEGPQPVAKLASTLGCDITKE